MNSLSFYIDAGWFLALFLVLLGIFRLHGTVTLLHPHNYNKKRSVEANTCELQTTILKRIVVTTLQRQPCRERENTYIF